MTRRRARGRAVLLPALAAAALAACAADAPRLPSAADARLVDLTWAFDAETVYWPTEEGFVHERGTAGTTDAGYYYEAHRFRGAEHGGTHLDAPIHFHADRPHADEIPLERLVGRAVVVDVSAAAGGDPDHLVGREELRAFEEAHGRIPQRAIVLLRTGWGARWPDRERYLGTARRGAAAVAELRFPGLGADGARWLVRERDVAAVGIDTASIDRGRARGFEAHRVLAAARVPIFENLARLEELPPTGLQVVALPMKIRGGSGAPLRIVALLPAAGGVE